MPKAQFSTGIGATGSVPDPLRAHAPDRPAKAPAARGPLPREGLFEDPGGRACCGRNVATPPAARLSYVQPMTDGLDAARPPRRFKRAIWRGFSKRCPNCGKGQLFGAYLKVQDHCPVCGEPLHHHRADDAPAYFTILIVGHFVVGGVLTLERGLSPPIWVHLVIWLPLTLIGSLFLLPRVKGALVALQWALYMHGFDPARVADPTVDPG